jgi:hypothetical protein
LRSLAVAFIYEDSETHRRATAVYEFLVQELDESAEMKATWWRTSILGDPKLSRVAARAIGASDLIVLAVRIDLKPAPAVQAWIESWPLGNGHPVQLLALLPQERNGPLGPNEWDLFLRHFVTRRGILYLPGTLVTSDAPSEMPDPEWTARPPAPARVIQPYLHGGLNE